MTHYFGAQAIVCEIPIVWRGTCTQSIHGPSVNVFSPKVYTKGTVSITSCVTKDLWRT